MSDYVLDFFSEHLTFYGDVRQKIENVLGILELYPSEVQKKTSALLLQALTIWSAQALLTKVKVHVKK